MAEGWRLKAEDWLRLGFLTRLTRRRITDCGPITRPAHAQTVLLPLHSHMASTRLVLHGESIAYEAEWRASMRAQTVEACLRQ